MKDMKKALLLFCIALLLCQAGCTRVPQDKEYVILKTIEENPEEYYSIFGLNKGLELIRVFGKDGTVLETNIVKKVEAAEYETENGFLRVQVEWEDGTRQSWFYDIEGCRRSKGFPADAEYIGENLVRYTKENADGAAETITANIYTGEVQK